MFKRMTAAIMPPLNVIIDSKGQGHGDKLIISGHSSVNRMLRMKLALRCSVGYSGNKSHLVIKVPSTTVTNATKHIIPRDNIIDRLRSLFYVK